VLDEVINLQKKRKQEAKPSSQNKNNKCAFAKKKLAAV
jgi:hypothetical protein